MDKFRLDVRMALHLGVVATAAIWGSAAAQEDNRFYVAPMATYVLSDDARHADDGIGGTLALGLPLSASAEIELRGTFIDYKAEDDGGEDVDITGGGFGVNLFFSGPGGPYIHGDVMGGDTTLFNLGLGWDVAIGKSFGIRAEALWHTESNTDDNGQEFREPLFNLGVRIPFGRAPEPPPPPAPAPVVVVPVPPPPPVCSDGLDNDGDGLIDFPADKGCTSADDGDETDPPPKCEAPEPGEAVNLDGCGVGDTIVLRGVNFDFDKSTLTVNAKSLLDGVAGALTKRPDIKVEIGGHTDAKGSDSYNASLSDRRARSVKTYLVGLGIAADRMSTKGYGESSPVADNETDEGRELNRRVELKVTESAGGGVSVAPPVPGKAEPQPEAAAPAPASAAASTVTIKGFAFSPKLLTVPVGTTVQWTNEDGSSHLVNFADQASDRLRQGGTYSRSFDTPGIYAYDCSIHPDMTGTVTVQ
ncbi:OmpA family protein [Panacagrimonas sp.]|uniref:OmpA family protein n=1 Tax=Panacagrimonas sp. TaxID=2480088 RepID=UPI003B525425